jgi:hypothetical protein
VKKQAMKKTYTYLLTLLFLAGLLSACEKDDPEVGYTAVGKAGGEWWVTNKVETSPGVFEDIYGLGYTPMLTYNTAENVPDQLWLDDQGSFWPYKFKASYDPSNMRITAVNAPSIVQSQNQNFTVNVTEGKVLMGVGLSRTKVPTDSIYFQVEFSDDPGTIYHVSGHRRTGFLEDEY